MIGKSYDHDLNTTSKWKMLVLMILCCRDSHMVVDEGGVIICMLRGTTKRQEYGCIIHDK